MKYYFIFLIILQLTLFGCDFSGGKASNPGSSKSEEGSGTPVADIPKSGLNFRMIKEAVQDFFSSKDTHPKQQGTTNSPGDSKVDSGSDLRKGSKGKSSDSEQEMESNETDTETPSLSDLQMVPEFPSQSSSDSPSDDDSNPDERKPRNRHKPNPSSESFFQQGESARKSGKCKQAIEYYEKAIESDRLFVEPVEGISQCYLDIKQYKNSKIYREMSDLLLSIHLAESALDMNPPLFLKEWKKRSAYEKMTKTDKMKFDKKYNLLSDHPILFDLSILNGWASYAKENGARYSETQKVFFQKSEKWFYEKAANRSRKAYSELPKKISTESGDFLYYQSIFLLWEIKNSFWGEKFQKVKELSESYQKKFPERYSEEEIDYWYYQPSLEKLGIRSGN
ncbi:MAG: hypothetical protein H7A24_17450 [Leptospiraceae bacterium]|nr:hypothetical protein [Leptospiraceae bacterium]MCP5513679.1 hypothetical protein [Leptospiraceae bacterium]